MNDGDDDLYADNVDMDEPEDKQVRGKQSNSPTPSARNHKDPRYTTKKKNLSTPTDPTKTQHEDEDLTLMHL